MKDAPNHRIAIIVFLGLALLTLAKLAYQDVPHIKLTVLTHNDVQPLYLSSRVWMAKGNPYDASALTKELERRVPGALEVLHGRCDDDCRIYYPPTAMPIFAIPSLLPWRVYFYLYLFLTAGVYLFCLYSLAGMLENRNLKLLFWGIGLAFSPFHAGIGSCNVSVLLIPIVLVCMIRYDGVPAALVMGLVACVKPPLGLLFVGYYVFRGQKKKAFASIGVIFLVAAISLLHLHGVDWIPSYKAAISHFAPTADSPGGVAQHGVANIGFLNLQVLAYMVLRDANKAVLLNNLAMLCLYVALLYPLFRSARDRYVAENHLAIMAALCSLTLFLPSLQYYNGLLLLGAALYALRLPFSAPRVFIGIACATFALPPRWFIIFNVFKRKATGIALASDPSITHVSLTFGKQIAAAVPSVLAAAISFVLIYELVRWRDKTYRTE